MTKRKPTSPSLYELIKKRPGAPSGPPEDLDHSEDVEIGEEPLPAAPIVVESGSGSWLAPGRAITVPVGYLLLAAAGVIIVGVLNYSIGYVRGREIERAARERSILADDGQREPGPRARDPLSPARAAGADVLARPEPTHLGGGDVEAAWPPPARAGDQPVQRSQWGPLESDPRVEGFNYFVLMETSVAGSRSLAEYCREEGLETYVVVSHNNPSRRLAIALPGYAPMTSRTSPEVQELERRIHSIGQRWQRHRSGATDLHDAYPLRHGSD